MIYDEELMDVAPPWSGIALTVIARGIELFKKEDTVFDSSWRPSVQKEPFIGSKYVAEAYIDTGSRSARSTSGVEEGFVLKTSVLLRYVSEHTLEERILYPYSTGSPSFLLVKGDDRQRQASLYVAELAMVLSLLQDSPNVDIDLEGKRIIVRHGSILQTLGTYFNKVFDLTVDTAEAILKYVGLNKLLVKELVDSAKIKRGLNERINPGLLAAAILKEIKKRSGKTGHSVIGLTEDVSRGRHHIAYLLAKTIKDSIIEVNGKKQLNPSVPVMQAIQENPEVSDCLSDLEVTSTSIFASETLEYFVRLSSQVTGASERIDIESLYTMDEEDIIYRIYEKQLLNFISLASDSHLLLLYNYLFGHPYGGDNENPISSIELDKSWLYRKRFIKSYEIRLEGENVEPAISLEELLEYTSGVKLRYLLIRPAPSCVELHAYARRLGIDRKLLSDLVQVVPPIRVEYYANPGWEDVINHVISQAMVTSYGVPPQLLVVDARSRVNEWEYSALAGLLEALSRRTTPYSTFIRDFSVRRHYLY